MPNDQIHDPIGCFVIASSLHTQKCALTHDSLTRKFGGKLLSADRAVKSGVHRRALVPAATYEAFRTHAADNGYDVKKWENDYVPFFRDYHYK